MKVAINAVIIQKGKLLMVRKNDSWFLPGGKVEKNEKDLECLARELDEELPELFADSFNYLGFCTGKILPDNTELEARLYLATFSGNIKTAAEIVEAKFQKDFQQLKTSELTNKILKLITEQGLLNKL